MMHMRVGDGNAFFLMADSIDLFLLNADWSMNYKQLWLLSGHHLRCFGVIQMCECVCEVENPVNEDLDC